MIAARLHQAAASFDGPGDELVALPLTALADVVDELERHLETLTGPRDTTAYYAALHVCGVAAAGAGVLVNGLLRYLKGDEDALTLMRHEVDGIADL